MLSQEYLDQIKKTAEEFFQKMTIDAEIEIQPQQELVLPVEIKTSEPSILIGERGHTLLEIQRLLGVMLKRQVPEQFYIDLDIDGYKKKKEAYLKEMARSAADEACLNKQEKQLPAMLAAERRMIHTELASRPDVTTESIGQEPQRCVIIRPYP